MIVLWKPARCLTASSILTDILTVGDLEERVAVVDELMKDSKVAFLHDYTTRKRGRMYAMSGKIDADRAL